ncbi:unnamed protein product [Rotaria socialis]|uniref:Uncharacterized protein n=1 Tax=Rotaria socialis TaxID=392032 RepID=A0A817T1D7_9BILA|nr:unnamed protein product [Rotaria socialis]CAF3498826.1 unnamed protein product [Rotaria socialis]CAF4952810.1 unnamed protein product [Rotaria socialis]
MLDSRFVVYNVNSGRSDAGGENVNSNSFIQTNTPFVEGQCSDAKLPDTVNVAIQIDDTQVHERYATKQNDFGEKSIRIISKCSLNQEISGSLQKY